MRDTTRLSPARHETTPIPRVYAQARRARVALVLGAVGVYVLAFFPLYRLAGAGVSALAAVPVIAVGGLLGARAGLLAGLLSFPLNTLLLNLVGYQPGGWAAVIHAGGGFGTVALMVVGGVAGRLRDLGEQVRRELAGHKQAEAALRNSEERFRLIADNVPVLLAYVDSERHYRFANKQYRQWFGLAPTDIIGRRLGEVIGEAAYEMVQPYVMAALSGQPVSFEIAAPYRYGGPRWVAAAYAPDFGDTGEVRGYYAVISDITERKRAEESLRESEARYRALYVAAQRQAQELALLDRVRTALSRQLDLPIVFRTVVEAIAETFGYTHIGLYLLQGDTLLLQHQVGFDHVIAEIPITEGITGRVARTGQPVLLEDAHADPTVLKAIAEIVSEVCVPLFDQDQVAGVLNVESTNGVRLSEADLQLMTALSEQVGIAIGRARLYAEARESEERFRALFEHSPEAILLVDPETFTIVDCNKVACSMNGYSRQELIGQPADMLNAVQVTDEVRAAYVQYLRQEGSLTYEIEHRRKDGTVFPVEVSAAAISVAGRELLLGVDRDITNRKRAEEAEHGQRALAEALRDVAAAVNSTINFEEVLDRILTNAGRVVPHDAASLMLVEQDVAYITRRHGHVEPGFETAVMAVHFTIADVPTLQVMSETGKPLAIPDTRAYPGWVDHPETRWVRSYVGAPVRLKGQVIGFLNLNSATPGFFTPAHADRLLAFADQAATAIQNARLYHAERRRVETLAALHDTGLALSAQLDLAVLLQVIVERAARLLATPMGELYLLLPDEVTLELKVGYNLPEELAHLRVRLGEGFSGRVAQTGEPLIVENYQSWPGRVAALDHTPFGAAVGVPIKWQERVVGVILVDDYQPDRFGAADVELLNLFADQAAVAIANAQLFDAAQRRLAEQSALLAASAAISSSLDLATVLTRLAEQMGRAIDATSVYICDWNPEAGTSSVLAEYFGPGALPQERVSDLGATYHLSQDFGIDPQWLSESQPEIFHVDDPDAPEGRRAHLARYGGRSQLNVPFVVKGKALGYAAVWESRRRRDFTPQEIALCQGLAQQAAIAFENAQLYSQTRRRLLEQTLLYECSQELALAQDTQTIFAAVSARMARHLAATAVCCYAYDEASQTVRLDYEYWTAQATDPERQSVLGKAWTLTDYSHLAAALRTLAPQVLHQSDSGLSLAERNMLADWNGQTVVAVPMAAHNRALGYFEIWDSRAERQYDDADLRLLLALATQTAVALENVQLLEALRRARDELELRVRERTAELERERGRMQAILDAAGEGIVLIDRNRVVAYANMAMHQLTGYTFAEAIGQPPHVWDSEHTSPAAIEALERHLGQGEAWRGEVINRRKDGALYDAALTLNPLRDVDGQVIGFVGVERDITHLKELDRLKNQFVSRIGHELRTPLTNIKLYLELLERGRPDRREQYMQTLHHETARLRRLVEGFLEISQLDADTVPIRSIPTDLNRLAADLIVDRRTLAAERGLSLDYQPEPDLPLALADSTLIAQVISNLMENALNYTPRGGRITFRTAARRHEEQDWITFAVQDTGPGISPEEMPRLFERFYRGEAARDFVTPGAGLGLAICKAIVDKLAGRITVNGAVLGDPPQRHGAAFTVWLRPAR